LIKWLIQSRRPIKEGVLDEVVVDEEEEEEVTQKALLIVEAEEEEEEEEVEVEEVVEVKMTRELGFQSQSWVVL
jgi:co-chaperonin GroES (HSP10)